MPSCSAATRPSTTTRSARLSAKSSKSRPVRRSGCAASRAPGLTPITRIDWARSEGCTSSRTSRSSSSTSQYIPAWTTPLSRSSRCWVSVGNGWSSSSPSDDWPNEPVASESLTRTSVADSASNRSLTWALAVDASPVVATNAADAHHRAERGQQRTARSAGDRRRGFADQVADRQRRLAPLRRGRDAASAPCPRTHADHSVVHDTVADLDDPLGALADLGVVRDHDDREPVRRAARRSA